MTSPRSTGRTGTGWPRWTRRPARSARPSTAAWTPGSRALAVVGNTLYFGGIFTAAAGQPRSPAGRGQRHDRRAAGLGAEPPTPRCPALTAPAGSGKVVVGRQVHHPQRRRQQRGMGAVDGEQRCGAARGRPTRSSATPAPAPRSTACTDGDAVYGAGWTLRRRRGNFESMFAADVDRPAALVYVSGCRGDTYDTAAGRRRPVRGGARARLRARSAGSRRPSRGPQQRAMAFRLGPGARQGERIRRLRRPDSRPRSCCTGCPNARRRHLHRPGRRRPGAVAGNSQYVVARRRVPARQRRRPAGAWSGSPCAPSRPTRTARRATAR